MFNFLKINYMENLVYTPSESDDVIKVHNELLTNSFGGWGASPVSGLLGVLLLSVLFNPTAPGKHPFPVVNDEEFEKEMENAETPEEKEEILKSHLDEYWTKMYNKTSNLSLESAQDLLDRLSDVDSKLRDLQQEKQDIIDEWVME